MFRYIHEHNIKPTNPFQKINEYFLHTIEVCHFTEARCIACVKTIKLEHGHVRIAVVINYSVFRFSIFSYFNRAWKRLFYNTWHCTWPKACYVIRQTLHDLQIFIKRFFEVAYNSKVSHELSSVYFIFPWGKLLLSTNCKTLSRKTIPIQIK